MPDDTQLREAFDDYLASAPALRTTPTAVLVAGRRARRRHRVIVATSTVAGVAAVLAAAYGLAPGVGPRSDVSVASAPSSAATFPGPVPALIEKTVRATLPDGKDLVREQIYPSDWNRRTPLPVSQTDNATDWHGEFAIPGKPDNELWIAVSIAPPGTNPTPAELEDQCAGMSSPGVPACTVVVRTDGSLLLTQITNSAKRWTRTLLHFRADDRIVNVREHIAADDYADALRKWHYQPAELAALATDPDLAIPEPVVRPPLPKGNR